MPLSSEIGEANKATEPAALCIKGLIIYFSHWRGEKEALKMKCRFVFFVLFFLVLNCGCDGSNNDKDNTMDNDGGDEDNDNDGAASDTDSDSDNDADNDADGGFGGDTDLFSFFAISVDAIVDLCGNEEGCGGDLGGLDGADDMCQAAAENVGAGERTWVAFLSVTDYNSQGPVNAVDRIGEGPWYNVDGLLLAQDRAGLLQMRPDGATDIVYSSGFVEWPFNQCLTDEFGECTLSYGDSHDTLTGSNRQGQLISADMKYTCNDWTSIDVAVQLPIGHTWPRQLNSTEPDEAHWILAHPNCAEGGADCNGCGANINLSNSFEEGVGGYGGYGGFYCFADLNE
jgi:hypothetical protein